MCIFNSIGLSEDTSYQPCFITNNRIIKVILKGKIQFSSPNIDISGMMSKLTSDMVH